MGVVLTSYRALASVRELSSDASVLLWVTSIVSMTLISVMTPSAVPLNAVAANMAVPRLWSLNVMTISTSENVISFTASLTLIRLHRPLLNMTMVPTMIVTNSFIRLIAVTIGLDTTEVVCGCGPCPTRLGALPLRFSVTLIGVATRKPT